MHELILIKAHIWISRSLLFREQI